jgi:hypothetical protein
VFAVIAIGVVKFACCHPDAVSLVKAAVPSKVPVAVHSRPVWLPVFADAL